MDSRSETVEASAIGLNFALAFIAGPAAYIGTWLAGATGHPVSPAWYLVVLALVALPYLWKWLPERAGRDIRSEHQADRGGVPGLERGRLEDHTFGEHDAAASRSGRKS